MQEQVGVTHWASDPKIHDIRVEAFAIRTSRPVTHKDLQAYEQRLAAGLNAFDEDKISHNEYLANKELVTGPKRKAKVFEAYMKIRQYKAVKHILDSEVRPPNCNNYELTTENPLTDILILLARNLNETPKDDYNGTYKFCLPGPAKRRRVLENWNLDIKHDQYSNHDRIGRKEYRTLARFDYWQHIAIRGLYLIARGTNGDKETLTETIDDFLETTGTRDAGRRNVAVGLLDVLHNAGLLDDPRFKVFSEQLGRIAIEEAGTFGVLHAEYHYRIMDKRSFWQKSWEPKSDRTQTGRIQERNNKQDTKPNDNAVTDETIQYPVTGKWDRMVRERQKIIDKVRDKTTVSALNSTMGATAQERVKVVARQIVEKDQLTSQLRSLEARLHSQLRLDMELFLSQFQDDMTISETDLEFVSLAARVVIDSFEGDRSLHPKLTDEHNHYYQMKPDELVAMPVFSWIVKFKQDPQFREVVNQWVQESPQSFYLLMKLVTYDVGRKFYATREKDFLYDAKYGQKVDPEKLAEVVAKLHELCNETKPNVWELMHEAKQELGTQTADLLTPQRVEDRSTRLRRIQRKDNGWIRERYICFTYKDMWELALSASIVFGTVGGILEVARYARENPDAFAWVSELSRGIGVGNKGLGGQNSRESAPWIQRSTEINGRIPDHLPPELVERIEPVRYGSVIHLPEGYAGSRGEEIAYFPQDIENVPEILTRQERDPGFQETRVQIVSELDTDNQTYRSNQLVYVMDAPRQVMRPPVGWKITQIVQEQGDQPFVATDGKYLLYNSNNLPRRVMLVVERLEEEKPDAAFTEGRVWEYKENQGYVMFNTDFDINAAYTLNDQLKGDPALQELHHAFITEMAKVKTDSGNDTVLKTEIVKRYVNLYAQYSNQRFYALGFKNHNGNPLISIADKPEEGYYCSVAAYAFKDFFGTAGVQVGTQPGIILRNYDGQLWGNQGHINNVIYLYDGTILYADMTPHSNESTPQLHQEALTLREPNKIQTIPDEIHKLLDYSPLGLVALPMLLLATQASLIAAGTASKKLVSRRVERYLKENGELSELEHTLVASVVSRLAFNHYDGEFAQYAADTLELLAEYSEKGHQPLMIWMTTTEVGKISLESADIAQAFKNIWGAYYSDEDNVSQQLPESVKIYFKNLNRKFKRDVDLEEDDIPHDFAVAYQLGKILYEEQRDVLAKVLTTELAIGFNVSTQSGYEVAYRQIPQKIETVEEAIKNLYAKRSLPGQNCAIINAILILLQKNSD